MAPPTYSLHRTDHDGHLRQDQAGEPERASVHASAGSSLHTNRLPVKKEDQIDMIILLIHIGTDMKMPYRITEENAQGLPFIDKVDAIISAHSHELVLDKINNIPIIQRRNDDPYRETAVPDTGFQRTPGYLFHPRDTVRVACEENPEMREAVEKIMDK